MRPRASSRRRTGGEGDEDSPNGKDPGEMRPDESIREKANRVRKSNAENHQALLNKDRRDISRDGEREEPTRGV